MKIITKILYYYLWVLVGFLVMMSFDMFGTEESFFMELLGFIIHASPAVILALILTIGKKHQLIYGILLFILAVALTFVFRPFRNLGDMWFSLVAIILPLLIYGIIEINLYLHKN